MSPTWNTIKSVLERREQKTLSSRAESSAAGIRRRGEDQLDRDYRLAFAVDVDRILHSLAYTRYIDKTQVFYLIENDHITHRVLHVQLVSRVARTIGRALGLNEDLIEAIALGHDIGHAPFGHEGETYLSKLCEQAGIGPFLHNVQSVHFLESVERKGRGCNLCLQTLDGILCHDGEIHTTRLRADRKKNFQTFEEKIAAKRRDPSLQLTPMTMEGCVVRFADTISYIGRDIEDAIRLGLVRRREIPAESAAVLGDTNGKIVYSLVTDVVTQSMDKDHIAFSEAVSTALRELKQFNYERIYMNRKIKSASGRIEFLFALLFERYLGDLKADNRASVIFTHFLKDMAPDYLERCTPPEVVRDFISGMTDNYFLRQCPPDMQPVLDVAGT
ncbi:MAG: HD domain-containing protein [Thermodesulfobacteriota bacterium]|nr:HD domain-containing protein [Thermodesulfobacteriota bacterium]